LSCFDFLVCTNRAHNLTEMKVQSGVEQSYTTRVDQSSAAA